MPVDAKHPQYEEKIDDWKMMRDCDEGERTIKTEGEEYLPKPTGFSAQKDGGAKYYENYKARARFPDILQPTLQGMVGVIHRVEAQIEGLEEGQALFPLWEHATKEGLPLEAFHRRITSELLLTGRYSILVDAPADGGMPYLCGYTAELLINWAGKELDLFVIDESRKVRGGVEASEYSSGSKEESTNGSKPKESGGDDEFTWKDEKKYRVLRLIDGVYTQQEYLETTPSGDLIEPAARAGKRLEAIPFVVVNPRETSLELYQAPLLGVAQAALAIYRLDADYRHQLFNSGQDTFVIIGETENLPNVLGSGVVVGLPTGSDAKYVGTAGTGIAAHRIAIMDERQAAVAAGVRLFDTKSQAESGEALRLRAAAQTATLTTIAQASAAALERSLRFAAIFMGQNPEEVIVKPNLQFVDTKMTPQEASQLIMVWQSGAISKQTLYEDLQRGEIASQERTFEEEEDIIQQEQIDAAAMGQGPLAMGAEGGMPPGGPNPALNGSGELAAQAAIPNRFIETGEGLTIEKA